MLLSTLQSSFNSLSPLTWELHDDNDDNDNDGSDDDDDNDDDDGNDDDDNEEMMAMMATMMMMNWIIDTKYHNYTIMAFTAFSLVLLLSSGLLNNTPLFLGL